MEGVGALYHGVLLGLVLIVSVGPIFFAVIETSISKGFWYALSISVGTFFSDLLYISLTYFGLSQFFQNETFKTYLGIGGGAVLVAFGIMYLMKKPDLHAADLHLRKAQSSYATYAFKGFIINTLNPFVFFFWLAVIGSVTVNYENAPASQLLFFTGVMATILLSDMLKAFVAVKIKHLMRPHFFLWVNRVVGGVMIYFGLRMLWTTLITP